jgi:hypothetical protein
VLVIGAHGGKGIFGAEAFRVGKLGNEGFGPLFIGNFGEQGPETAYGFEVN